MKLKLIAVALVATACASSTYARGEYSSGGHGPKTHNRVGHGPRSHYKRSGHPRYVQRYNNTPRYLPRNSINYYDKNWGFSLGIPTSTSYRSTRSTVFTPNQQGTTTYMRQGSDYGGYSEYQGTGGGSIYESSSECINDAGAFSILGIGSGGCR